MQLFYIEDLCNDWVTLPAEESRHCSKVLRLRRGDELHLTDGCGLMCRAEVDVSDPRATTLHIVERTTDYGHRPYYLHMAVAPTKNAARYEWFVEKAVEIGVDEITLLRCDHSERTDLNLERLERIVVSAMKQSLKAYKPRLNAPTTMDKLLATPFEGLRLMGYCTSTDRTPIGHADQAGVPTTILIGPEGDFSEREVAAARVQGVVPITLGESRLRTETAALMAVACAALANQASLT